MEITVHAPVLVLNANFEPINVCDTRRALGLILNEKAHLVLNGRGTIRSVSQTFQIPAIIRLKKMIRRPRPNVKLTKREILRRDNFTCQYCGKNGAILTIDHILPRHMGGEHTWENLVTACPACNHHKGGRTIDQAKMRLMHIPAPPPTSAGYIFARHLKENDEWIPFIEGW